MAVIGADTITSIARHYIAPEITDIVYPAAPFFFRMNAAKKIIPGGTQLEYPLMYSQMSAGGPFSGFDVLTMTPSDTVKNGLWQWKQHYVPIVIDGLTLIKTDSPLAIANIVRMQFEQAEMQLAQNLDLGIMSDGTTNAKEIDGLQLAVDSTGTYAGLARSTNAGIASQEDGTTTVLTLTALNSLHGNCRKGGRAPSLIMSRQDNYNRYWKLAIDKANVFLEPVARDTMMGDLGWGGLLFNGVPWVVDDNVFDGANTSNSSILMLNEDYIHLAVSPRGDFYVTDFQTPVNQQVMAARIEWAGNLIVRSPGRQGKMNALTS